MNVRRVVCQELAPTVGDLAGNLERSVDAVAQAAALGADVVVLPELCTSGYVFASGDEARGTAVGLDHAVFGRWAAALPAAGVLVAGFCEAGDDGALYNSAAVVGRDGVLAVHRKTHLWDTEQLWFAPGAAPPRVVDTPAGRIGVLICYEQEFPELTRGLALAGAELLALPTNWPAESGPGSRYRGELGIAVTTARTNRLPVACCDRSGTERGQAWAEGSAVVDARGFLAGDSGDGHTAVADVSLAGPAGRVLSARNDTFGDRRPEIYELLGETGSGTS